MYKANFQFHLMPGHLVLMTLTWQLQHITSAPHQCNLTTGSLIQESWEFTEIKGNHSGANTTAMILQVIDCYGIRHKIFGSVIKHKFLLSTIFSLVGLQQIMPLPMTMRCVSCNDFLTAPLAGNGLHLNVMAGMTNILFFICWC